MNSEKYYNYYNCTVGTILFALTAFLFYSLEYNGLSFPPSKSFFIIASISIFLTYYIFKIKHHSILSSVNQIKEKTVSTKKSKKTHNDYPKMFSILTEDELLDMTKFKSIDLVDKLEKIYIETNPHESSKNLIYYVANTAQWYKKAKNQLSKPEAISRKTIYNELQAYRKKLNNNK